MDNQKLKPGYNFVALPSIAVSHAGIYIARGPSRTDAVMAITQQSPYVL